MANNRIYLRCKQCGDVLYLGKTIGNYELCENKMRGNNG